MKKAMAVGFAKVGYTMHTDTHLLLQTKLNKTVMLTFMKVCVYVV